MQSLKMVSYDLFLSATGQWQNFHLWICIVVFWQQRAL